MSKELRKQDLIKMGIRVEYPFVYKTMKLGKEKKLKKHMTVNYQGRKYSFYNFYHEGRNWSFMENRIIFAWYNGDIPENHEIINKDGDELNNYFENLEMRPMKGRKAIYE